MLFAAYHAGTTLSDRTSGTPTLGCQADRPGGSSTISRCSGSEMHAEMKCYKSSKYQRTQRQAYIADSPSNGALLTRGAGLISLAFNTEIHDVIAANSAVVDDNVCKEI